MMKANPALYNSNKSSTKANTSREVNSSQIKKLKLSLADCNQTPQRRRRQFDKVLGGFDTRGVSLQGRIYSSDPSATVKKLGGDRDQPRLGRPPKGGSSLKNSKLESFSSKRRK